MLNQPLQSSDYAKLVGFTVLMALSLYLAVIPAVILVYVLLAAKDKKEFALIEAGVRYCKIYFALLVLAALGPQLYLIIEGEKDLLPFLLLPLVVGFAYTIGLNKLFLDPLATHREWVVEYGIFKKNANPAMAEQVAEKVQFVRFENANAVSSADELIKWIRLKEDGHITEEEFQTMRRKSLG